MPDVNIWAVLSAAGTSFLLGGLWYSKGFLGNVWNREAGRAGKNPGEGRHPARVFAVSFLFAVLSAYVFALFLAPASFAEGLERGFLVGAGIVAASFGINYAFAGRSWTLWLIDGGYHTAQFTLYGLVLAAWS